MSLGVSAYPIVYSYQAVTTYVYKSRAKSNGAHTVKVYAIDELGNTSILVSASITLNTYLRAAENLTHELLGNSSIDLSWDVSPDDADAEFAFYNIYNNAGSGEIDYDTPVAQLAAGVITYNTGILANGDWLFGLRVKKTDGKIEDNVHNVIRQIIPNVPDAPGMPGSIDDDTQTTVLAVAGGKAKIYVIYPYTAADHFNVYWRKKNSGQAFTYGSPQQQFDYQTAAIQDFTTDQITYEESDTYEFVVRAATASNVEEENTDMIEVVLDGRVPDAPTGLTLTAIASDEVGSIE